METRIKGKQKAIWSQKEEKEYDVWIQDGSSKGRRYSIMVQRSLSAFSPFDTGQGSGPSHNNMQV
jgi:hypothetical protein